MIKFVKFANSPEEFSKIMLVLQLHGVDGINNKRIFFSQLKGKKLLLV